MRHRSSRTASRVNNRRLNTKGHLIIKRSYAWDGPSGPTIDTKNFMRGSLVHDALYQLMRHEHLSSDEWRAVADLEHHEVDESRIDGALRHAVESCVV